MKRNMKKVLCVFLILLTLFNFIYSSKTYASEIIEDLSEGVEQTGDFAEDALSDGVAGILDGVTGVLLWPLRAIAVILGSASRIVASSIGNIGAEGSFGSEQSTLFLSLEDVLFHNVKDKVPIINVNFFKSANENGKGEVISDIQKNIANWYYTIRNLAIIISLLVLIYIGIRMAISTLADDKAKYKNMLKDWVVGFITIFLLHYIIIATVYTNEALVKALYPTQNEGFMNEYIDKIYDIAINPAASFFRGTAATIVYVFMTTLIFVFLFSYIKRMITIAFLIIIAPIITVTYSIDKIGDGKSQALNTWLKEFVYNVLIQPFHCIIYMVFSTLLISILSQSDLGSGVIAIIIMLFIKQAEGIVRSIFGFGNAKSLGSAFASTALLYGSMQTLGKALGKVKNAPKPSSGTGNLAANTKKPRVKDTSNVGNQNNVNNGLSLTKAKGGAQNTINNTRNANNNSTISNNLGNINAGNNSVIGGINGANSTGGTKGVAGGNGSGSSGVVPNGGTSSINNGLNNASTQNYMPQNQQSVQNGPREYNTAPSKTIEEKRKSAVDKLIKANLIGLEAVAGVGIGGALTGDLNGMIAAGTAVAAGVNAVPAGIDKIKGIGHDLTRNSRIDQKTNDVIDAYSSLQNEKGWDNDRMLDETERALGMSDTSRIKDDKMRAYAETVQSLREEYEGKYQSPNDMVLDRVSKIQSGEVQKTQPKRFTRPKTNNTNPNINNMSTTSINNTAKSNINNNTSTRGTTRTNVRKATNNNANTNNHRSKSAVNNTIRTKMNNRNMGATYNTPTRSGGYGNNVNRSTTKNSSSSSQASTNKSAVNTSTVQNAINNTTKSSNSSAPKINSSNGSNANNTVQSNTTTATNNSNTSSKTSTGTTRNSVNNTTNNTINNTSTSTSNSTTRTNTTSNNPQNGTTRGTRTSRKTSTTRSTGGSKGSSGRKKPKK